MTWWTWWESNPHFLHPECSPSAKLGYKSVLVGREGLEPSVFLTLWVYSPLTSPLVTPAHVSGGLRELNPPHRSFTYLNRRPPLVVAQGVEP